MKGTLYNFFPVTLEEGDDDCETIDCLQWRYFSWLFYCILYSRQFVCTICNLEYPPFIIKVNKDEYNKCKS